MSGLVGWGHSPLHQHQSTPRAADPQTVGWVNLSGVSCREFLEEGKIKVLSIITAS